MKMATGDDSPSDKVPEQGPDWFLVATEASGGGTPDLCYVSGISVFIVGFGVENNSGGPTGVHEAQGRAPGGWGRPPPSCAPRDSPPITFRSSIFYIFQKYSPLIFNAFQELLFLHKNNITVVLLKTALVQVSSVGFRVSANP